MSENIIKFPGRRDRRRSHCDDEGGVCCQKAYRGSGVSIRTLCFRSRELILESDEADLVRDIYRDPHKAQVKLRLLQRGLKGLQERTARYLQAEIKFKAAMVAALLSTRGKDETSSQIAPKGRRLCRKPVTR